MVIADRNSERYFTYQTNVFMECESSTLAAKRSYIHIHRNFPEGLTVDLRWFSQSALRGAIIFANIQNCLFRGYEVQTWKHDGGMCLCSWVAGDLSTWFTYVRSRTFIFPQWWAARKARHRTALFICIKSFPTWRGALSHKSTKFSSPFLRAINSVQSLL